MSNDHNLVVLGEEFVARCLYSIHGVTQLLANPKRGGSEATINPRERMVNFEASSGSMLN